MENIKARWQELSVRDQLSVFVLGVCVCIYFLFNFILGPVVEMKEKQVRRVEAQQAAYVRVKTLAAEWKNRNTGDSAASVQQSVEKAVQSSFALHGLRVSGFDASGRSGIRIRFDSAEYEKLIAWFYDMEITQGLRMRDINIATTSDVGIVTASVLIQKK